MDDMPPLTPLSPPAPLPWARLVPCVPSKDNFPVDLIMGQSEYWLGRSSTKCEIPVKPGTSLSKKEQTILEWAHSMISNQHCRIVYLSGMSSNSNSNGNQREDGMEHDEESSTTTSSSSTSRKQQPSHFLMEGGGHTPPVPQILLEDHSGNGTLVNQSVHLRKGHQRLLHSGDEICLVNPDTLGKRISSSRRLRQVLQHYTYVLVLSNKPRRPCVNPRAMNYTGTQLHPSSSSSLERATASPRSARLIEAYYEIREILGDGTSGQVRRAIHRQSGKEYAVKIISLRRQIDLTSMEHEVNMMQSLDHPYIVQLVDVFVHHGIAMYVVMELVAGGDLFDRIVQQERYSEVDARRVMRRLLSAVNYLHQTKNIVHRDLKPENILCTSPTHVKLADFGLAKIIQGDGLKTFCGTPQYFAPEVLQRRTTVAGSGRYGKPADIWSLGVILYILLTGRPPFEVDLDPMQAFVALDFDDPIWHSMPQAQELVQQMLRLDPKRRITVRQACDHPWINTPDGDTHLHPLDDPAVTGRKRLFETSNDAVLRRPQEEEEEGNKSMEGSEEDSHSTVSKESHLSKADFAAAATLHQRVESIDFLHVQRMVQTADSTANDDNMEEESKGDAAENVEEDTATNSPGKHQEDKDDGDCLLDKKSTDANLHPSPTISERNEMSTDSPDQATTDLIARELSVTPSECGDEDPPRSPLAAMNLNERSNRFRAHVLRQQQQSSSPDAGNASPNGRTSRDAIQVAVTPMASNIRPMGKVFDESELCNEGVEEDPILSQFSSDPSSLESFPESPIKGEEAQEPQTKPKDTGPKDVIKGTKNTQRKRKRGIEQHAEGKKDIAGEDDDTSKAKHSNQKQVRQTNLSAWFVSKKGKFESK